MFQKEPYQFELRETETKQNEKGILEPQISASKKQSGKTQLQSQATSSEERKDNSEVGVESPEAGVRFTENCSQAVRLGPDGGTGNSPAASQKLLQTGDYHMLPLALFWVVSVAARRC